LIFQQRVCKEKV